MCCQQTSISNSKAIFFFGGGHPNCVIYLDNDYKRHFGSDHMPVVDVVFILLRVPGRVAEISIPKKTKKRAVEVLWPLLP